MSEQIIYTIIPIVILLFSVAWASQALLTELAAVHAGRYWFFRLVLFPGVVFHETAHVLACWLTNTPIETIELWTETGGRVVHRQPKWAIIQPLISFAPFFSSLAALALMTRLPGGPWWIVGLKIYASIIIAATLAPSKADVAPTLQGLATLALIVAVASWLFPGWLTGSRPFLLAFSRQLLGLLVLIWLAIAFLRIVRRAVW